MSPVLVYRLIIFLGASWFAVIEPVSEVNDMVPLRRSHQSTRWRYVFVVGVEQVGALSRPLCIVSMVLNSRGNGIAILAEDLLHQEHHQPADYVMCFLDCHIVGISHV